MKKNVLLTSVLITGVLLTACGGADSEPGTDTVPGSAGNGPQSYAASDNGGPGSDTSGNSSAGEGSSETGGLSMDEGMSMDEGISMDELKAAGELDTEMKFEEEDVLLSDHILKAGDTMQIMYPNNDGTLYNGLDITLHGAEVFDSPEAAGLNRAQMQEETENYDTSGNPEWCGIDDANLLVCDLAVRNIDGNPDGDLHISEIMIVYADPVTGKVSIVSSFPAYFSASISNAGASDYYHYQVPKGESMDMKVAWAVQKEYAVENLYLCVTYDVREPQERQYFRLSGQSM